FPSRVHSANLISQTNTGLTQCILRIIEGVIPWTHWPFCFDGRSTNGHSAHSSARNFLCNIDNDFVVNPVPTLPANTSFLFSWYPTKIAPKCLRAPCGGVYPPTTNSCCSTHLR